MFVKNACLQTAFGLLWAATNGFGQSPPAQPSFEVASIKPALSPAELNRSGQAHLGVKIDGATADFGGVTLMNLIARAYRVRAFQVSGPDWMKSARFDIAAKLPEGASPGQAPEMLQTLLAERFKLALHRISKEFPVYALIVGKNGPKLSRQPQDYDPAVKGNIKPMTLDSYAEIISMAVDRPVIDLTGLQGEYMVSLEFLMQDLAARMTARRASPAASDGGAPAASDPRVSSAFQDVQTLGLKLEPRKLPLPFLVIDHLEKLPTEN